MGADWVNPSDSNGHMTLTFLVYNVDEELVNYPVTEITVPAGGKVYLGQELSHGVVER